jgi:hypothetical protein
MPPPEDRAELLRRDLMHVGVTRKALHIEGDPLCRAIVFHDLRDTGLTHMAVRGDAPIVIQWAGVANRLQDDAGLHRPWSRRGPAHREPPPTAPS